MSIFEEKKRTEEKGQSMADAVEMEKIKPRGRDRTIWSHCRPRLAFKCMHARKVARTRHGDRPIDSFILQCARCAVASKTDGC